MQRWFLAALASCEALWTRSSGYKLHGSAAFIHSYKNPSLTSVAQSTPTSLYSSSQPKMSMRAAESLKLLVLDFDDTMVKGDTTPLLPLIAKQAYPERQSDIDAKWTVLTEQFLSTYQAAVVRGIGDAPAQNEAFEGQGLQKFLDTLDEVDLASIHRVSKSKVLAGLTVEDIKKALLGPLRSQWVTRTHMADCVNRALATDLSFQRHILSINFSQDVIETILESEIGGSFMDKVTIFSNNLAFAEDGRTTGEIVTRGVGASGKLRVFEQLLAGTADSEGLTMYVGDSVTDLLAMLRADIGVVVGESATFRKVASAYGVRICPLSSDALIPAQGGGWKNGGVCCVYEAKSWDDINHFLFE